VTVEQERELDHHFAGKSITAIDSCLRRASPIKEGSPLVDTVLLGDLMTALPCMCEIRAVSHQLGNEARGFPGTVILKFTCSQAESGVAALRGLLGRVSIQEIADHEMMCLFIGHVDEVQAGVDYLIKALQVPERFSALILRMN